VRHVHVETDNVHSLLRLGETRVKRSYQIVSDFAASIEQLIGIVCPIFCFRRELPNEIFFSLSLKLLFFAVVTDNYLRDVFAGVVD
jgi:hypothetical protein